MPATEDIERQRHNSRSTSQKTKNGHSTQQSGYAAQTRQPASPICGVL